ncbi:MAG TPA: energy-coupling factor ABC transporter permease [Azonexus sp.]|nr:energy-coupling factor ABC transporter permease [Azonexus sp.]
MNLPDTLLGEGWYWAAWAVWLPLFLRSLVKAPWTTIRESEQLNVWLGMIVLLMLIWSLKAGVKPGLSLHLLGATVFTLSFGPHLAFVGLSLVLFGITLNGEGGFFAYAINALLTVGVGVMLSQMLYRLVLRLLPRHFFVYVFINGFFAAALTVFGVGLAATLLLGIARAYEWEYLATEYLPYFILLGFSEAWLSGMLVTLFAVYRPDWIVTFDDSSYLTNK